jgi:hypothetical protein
MRRTAALVSAVALVATGVALATPAGAAALKPGVPTAVKAVPASNGTVLVTWKAPAVKKGKTAKATTFAVVCTGAKKVTVKTTTARVTLVKIGFKNGVVCTVSGVAGKAVGKAGRSNSFTAYRTIAVAKFTLDPTVATAFGTKLGALAPGTFSGKTRTITLPVVNVIPKPSQPDDNLVLAGALTIGGISMPNIQIVPNPAYTDDVPIYDVQGNVTSLPGHPVKVVLTLENLAMNADGTVTTFDVNLTTDTTIVTVLKALDVQATAGMHLGSGSITLF